MWVSLQVLPARLCPSNIMISFVAHHIQNMNSKPFSPLALYKIIIIKCCIIINQMYIIYTTIQLLMLLYYHYQIKHAHSINFSLSENCALLGMYPIFKAEFYCFPVFKKIYLRACTIFKDVFYLE